MLTSTAFLGIIAINKVRWRFDMESKELRVVSEYLDGSYYYNVCSFDESNPIAVVSLGFVDYLLSSDGFTGFYEDSVTKENILQFLQSCYGESYSYPAEFDGLVLGISDFLMNCFWLFNDYSDKSYHLLGYEIIEYKRVAKYTSVNKGLIDGAVTGIVNCR